MNKPDRKKPAIDMNGFRRDLRFMWQAMQLAYRDGVDKPYIVPFPEMRLVQQKRMDDEA